MRTKFNNKSKKKVKGGFLLDMKNERTIKISFSYDPKLVAQVRVLNGRKFHKRKNEAYWCAPLTVENIMLLRSFGNLRPTDKYLEASIEVLEKKLKPKKKKKIKKIPGLKAKLYDFQSEGVEFLELQNGRGLIADEMGLGKTIQSLAWLQLHPEVRPAVVVCPASVKLNWEKEIKTWMTKQNVVILNGKTPYPIPSNLKNNIFIINYDILSSWKKDLLKMNPKVLILDESHYIKSNKAKRTRTTKAMAKKIDHLICLSGTPIVNRPIEMYNVICMLDPDLFPSFFKFVQRYCDATHNGFGWDFNGASNKKELHKKLTESIMIRRLKKDVLTELPEKIRTVVPMRINNRKKYDRVSKDFIGWLQKIDPEKASRAQNAEVLSRIEALKQLTIEGKLDACYDWIDDYLKTEDKLVVFCHHKTTVDALMKRYGKIAVKMDGGSKHRQKTVDAFQKKKKIKLFVGTGAAKEGITLTAASSTCFLELWWVPGFHSQAEDRVHRIGQEADSVNAYYLIAENTIEIEIMEMLDEKMKVISAILDGKEVDETSTLKGLLKKLNHK